MTKAKSCKIGKTERREKSCEDWQSRPRTRGSAGSPVGSLPPPPPPGSPKDIECGDEWFQAYADAKAVENEQEHLASMLYAQELAKALPASPNRTALLKELAKQIADQRVKIQLMTNALGEQVASYMACLQGVQA